MHPLNVSGLGVNTLYSESMHLHRKCCQRDRTPLTGLVASVTAPGSVARDGSAGGGLAADKGTADESLLHHPSTPWVYTALRRVVARTGDGVPDHAIGSATPSFLASTILNGVSTSRSSGCTRDGDETTAALKPAHRGNTAHTSTIHRHPTAPSDTLPHSPPAPSPMLRTGGQAGPNLAVAVVVTLLHAAVVCRRDSLDVLR